MPGIEFFLFRNASVLYEAVTLEKRISIISVSQGGSRGCQIWWQPRGQRGPQLEKIYKLTEVPKLEGKNRLKPLRLAIVPDYSFSLSNKKEPTKVFINIMRKAIMLSVSLVCLEITNQNENKYTTTALNTSADTSSPDGRQV